MRSLRRKVRMHHPALPQLSIKSLSCFKGLPPTQQPLYSHVQIPHHRKYHEADTVNFAPIPLAGFVEQWDDTNRSIIMSAPGRPHECNRWWNAILKAKNIAELEEPLPSCWDTLALKAACDLKKKFHVRPELHRKVTVTGKEL